MALDSSKKQQQFGTAGVEVVNGTASLLRRTAIVVGSAVVHLVYMANLSTVVASDDHGLTQHRADDCQL